MKSFILACVMAVLLAGCGNPPKTETPPTPPPINIPGVNPEAGKPAAQKMMWPFMFAGFIGLVGGIFAFAFLRDLKILIAGAVIALIPPMFFLFLEPWVFWIGLMCMFVGLCLCAYVGYLVLDKIEDRIYEQRRDRKREEEEYANRTT